MAHEDHPKGNLKDAVHWCLKAFESTLKANCVARNWPFDPQRDRAKQLLDIIYAQKLVPSINSMAIDWHNRFNSGRIIRVGRIEGRPEGQGAGAGVDSSPDQARPQAEGDAQGARLSRPERR
jgi:hypothetical protein